MTDELISEEEDFLLEQAREQDYEEKEARADLEGKYQEEVKIED